MHVIKKLSVIFPGAGTETILIIKDIVKSGYKKGISFQF